MSVKEASVPLCPTQPLSAPLSPTQPLSAPLCPAFQVLRRARLAQTTGRRNAHVYRFANKSILFLEFPRHESALVPPRVRGSNVRVPGHDAGEEDEEVSDGAGRGSSQQYSAGSFFPGPFTACALHSGLLDVEA
jgi:hypothetical protein